VNRDRLTYLVVLMALNTGMRKMEILTRKWSDVRWAQGSNGALFVGDQPDADFRVKTGRERTIPLAPQLKAELERAWAHPERSNSSWVFPAPHNPEIPRRDFIKALKRACRRAGIPEVGPHSLRHTWATRFAMQGCDRRTLMELGGWTASSRVLDEVYSHSSDAHKEEMIARLGIESSSGPTRARPSTVPSLRLVEDDSADSDRPPRPEQNPQRADVQNGE
jgi:integrase